MQIRYALMAVMATAICLPTSGQAAKVKVWHHYTPAHYEKAHFKQVVISNEGVLRLSRQLKPLTNLQATHVWDVVEDKAGNLFVATGDEGKIYRVTGDGKVSVAYACEDSQVLCLALAGDGTLYAGTGPGGLILRITAAGTGSVFYKSPESYIWSLAVDARGQTLYAGTGPKGRIYEITAQGAGRVFYSSRQEHILTLARGANDLLYAGTDKDGLVYRIDAKGKGFVLFNAPQTEIRSLLVAADGIYVGTSSPTRRRGTLSGSSAGRSSPSSSSNVALTAAPADRARTGVSTGETTAAHTSSGSNDSGDSHEKAVTGVPASAPAVGENSLYRVAADGTVREIFREKALLLSLLKQDGRILIGTGLEGQLFEVDEATRERSELARLDHGQIHCLCRRKDGSIVVGTGDPGKLYVLQEKYSPAGTVLSEVLDAKLISKWGSLRWKGDSPVATRVAVSVRSGNTAEPDQTWSEWTAEQIEPERAIINAPTARFLQYRVTLSTDNPARTPAVQSLTLRYMTTNHAPEVTSIQVPDLDAAALENPKKIRFKWTATDANEDELTYSLFIRKDGWKNWVQLEDDLERSEYDCDTTTMTSGVYQLKVVACDRRDNPEEDCLSGQRISTPFVVAHEAPTVTLKNAGLDGDQATIEATATDPLVRLTSAAFSVNGKKWVNVFPTDGLFDSKSESFRFKTDTLKPGSYVVVLKVRDAAGNSGSGEVVFTVPSKASRASRR